MELNNCPFCNGEAIMVTLPRRKLFRFSKHYFYVKCGLCRATSGVFFTEAEAENAWNRRANDET